MTDLHVIADALGGIREEQGRITISSHLLALEPERLCPMRLRDAYLHVAVDARLLSMIRMRVGRAGAPGRREGGNIWSLV